MPIELPIREKYHSELRRIDWDFSANKRKEADTSFHWYPARFISRLPGILINYFSSPGEKVLDPFCGSGTTLVESYKFGRRAVGIDINPIATLIAKTRLTKYDSNEFSAFKELLHSAIKGNLLQIRLANNYQLLETIVPNFAENSLWYHFDTLVELAAIWKSLNEVKDSSYYNVGLTAFSATLKKSCSQDKHWGWVCDNVKPKNLIFKESISKFLSKLNEYQVFASEVQQEAKELQEAKVCINEIEVLQGSCDKVLTNFSSNSFDLVVTSPPYYNVTDYINAQRLSNLWVVGDTEEMKKAEIGARYRRRKLSAFDDYLSQMKNAFTQIHRVLRHNSFCCVVLGESPNHQPYITKFQKLCYEIGFETDDILDRNVSKGRRFIPSVHQETILILKKV